MGYLHINNLYKDQDVLHFRHLWALEKIHGTSAHVAWDNGLRFHAGGEKYESFVALFHEAELEERFDRELGPVPATVYGEAYGGKQQRMAHVYGPKLRFVAFDVKVGDSWLKVPDAAELAKALGFEFVDHKLIDAEMGLIDDERDRPSEQARRNGAGEGLPREGVVLRPPIEVVRSNGTRVIAKHKQDGFCERMSPQKVVDLSQVRVLTEATAIAREWVTEMRLDHVLDQVLAGGAELELGHISAVNAAMKADIEREAEGEIVWSAEARRAVGSRTAELVKARLRALGRRAA